ncbi:DUF3375 domain-containing protein [Dietzia cinnamea]|uniref:DUF3375 domain-containing protein n=1 Tax=Dietzia cinnamea TaxID=321318 RepID=UPI000A017FB8|nr:DUF3375 domain-containing protein [Dietzia cinnamea]PWD94777.1 DUF3375 domain-containing protein [Dietzia maris]
MRLVSALARFLQLSRLNGESSALSLMRAQLWPLIVAVLAEVFEGSSRRVPSSEFYEFLDRTLTAVRDSGADVPGTAQAYVRQWVDAGWMLRRPGTAATGETLEPTQSALVVMDFLDGLQTPRRGLTVSRVETLTRQLEDLARDTDPSVQGRLAALHRERDRIDAAIARVEAGDLELADPEQVGEKVSEILRGADDIPADFARVRAEFESLNQDLRRRLLDQDGARGDVLDAVFGGVDLIGDSEAGRSFSSFYSVLLDPERSASVDTWIDDILSRPQVADLPPSARRGLRELFDEMETAGAEVNGVLTSLSRSLRHFVTSDAYVEHRQMLALIRSARAAAAEASGARAVKPTSQMSVPLRRIGMSVRSVSALRLRNPGEERVAAEVAHHEEGHADLESLTALVRASEIDEAELRAHVRDVVSRLGPSSIGAILREHPATQGVASIVGLLNLAITTQAEAPPDDPCSVETVTWTSGSGPTLSARIPTLVFTADRVLEEDL